MTDTASTSLVQASERKQIVAWLRASGHSDPGAFAQRAYATAFADAIERGDHLATPVEASPVDTVNEFDGPCPVCRCRTFAAVDDEFAPGRFQRCVECKTILALAIYKASEPSPVDVERVAKAGHALIANLNGYAARLSGDTIAAVRHLHNALAALQSPPVEQPAQAEAQQPSDGLVEELEFALSSGRVEQYYARLAISKAITALKTRTSPETTFADELAERVRRAFSNDAAALITGELSDGRRYVVMPFDHYESELLKRQKRGAEQALRTSPETVELLREAREHIAERDRAHRAWGYTKSAERTSDLLARIDAHLSNTPGKESSDG